MHHHLQNRLPMQSSLQMVTVRKCCSVVMLSAGLQSPTPDITDELPLSKSLSPWHGGLQRTVQDNETNLRVQHWQQTLRSPHTSPLRNLLPFWQSRQERKTRGGEKNRDIKYFASRVYVMVILELKDFVLHHNYLSDPLSNDALALSRLEVVSGT